MAKISRDDKIRIQTLREQGLGAKAIKKVYAPPTNKTELQAVLEKIWDDLPQQSVEKAILSFRKRLQMCIKAHGGHIEHLVN